MSEHEFDEKTIEEAAKAGRNATARMEVGEGPAWEDATEITRCVWRRIAHAVLTTVAFIVTSLRRTVDVMAAEIVALKESAAGLIRERDEARAALHAAGYAHERIMAEVVTLRAQRRAVEEFVAAYTSGATTLPHASTDVCAARHVAATQAGRDVGEREQCKPAEVATDPDVDVIAHMAERVGEPNPRRVWLNMSSVVRDQWRADYARSIPHDDGPGPANDPAKWSTPEEMVRASEAYADRSANTFATAVGIVHERDEQTASHLASLLAEWVDQSHGPALVERIEEFARMLRGGAS